jgi:adenylosuccinate synthase
MNYENGNDVSKAKDDVRKEYYTETGRPARVGHILNGSLTKDYIEWLEISFHKLNAYFDTVVNCHELASKRKRMKLSTETIRQAIIYASAHGLAIECTAMQELAVLEANQILVRCKDCKNAKRVISRGGMPGNYYNCVFSNVLVEPDHYCGYGEAKK